MLSQLTQTVRSYPFFPFVLLIFSFGSLNGQSCPDLDATATLISPGCTAGNTPCDLCPGDVMTLTGSGGGLVPGNCINWYYGNSATFNPYNGEGTLMGCSPVSSTPPDPCTDCPLLLSLFINACGTEQNNEYMVLWSGSGFFVNDISVDFDANNNGFSPENEDINAGGNCGWQTPSNNALQSIQTICPNATVVGVGPGGSVPPDVPVIVFTSAGYDFNYNFGGLCPLAPVIYVMQNDCARTIGAFTNTGTTTRTTSVDLPCGCSAPLTYDLNLNSGNDGDFVIWTPVFPIYGNLGCGFPSFPSFPTGGGNPISVEPLDFTVPAALCGNGPFWVVGVADPLSANCPETFTNYMPFDVPCPPPTLGAAQVCILNGLYDLTQLEDPNLAGGGVWSGQGVTGNSFDPTGLSGTITLTFTPNSDCSMPATTTVEILNGPTASMPFGASTICEGDSVRLDVLLMGDPPFTVEYAIDGIPQGMPVTTSNSPLFLDVFPPLGMHTITLASVVDANMCQGQVFGEWVVNVVEVPTVEISGTDTVCRGQNANCNIIFTGTGEWTICYTVNGACPGNMSGGNFCEYTTDDNPDILTITPDTTSIVEIICIRSAGGCEGTATGTCTIVLRPAPEAVLESGADTVCFKAPVDLEVNFSGTTPPYNFSYAVNGVVRDTLTSMDTTYTLTVQQPAPGVNVITLNHVDNGVCNGDVSGTYTLTVLDSVGATINGSNDTICGSSPVDLTVSFSGTGPYTYVYTANGMNPDTVFTTKNPDTLTVVPTANTTYALTQVVANGCNGPVSGAANVVVLDSLTATLSGGGQICQGDTIGTNITFTFTGQGPYTFVYNAGFGNPQTPITTSDSVYTIKVVPLIGTIYSLVSVSNGICNGTVSGTASVFVFTPPTAEIFPSDTFCFFANTELYVNLTGTGPFEYQYAINGVLQPPVNTFDDPDTIAVMTGVDQTYELVSISSPGCNGVIVGPPAVVTIVGTPDVSNIVQNCNPGNMTYTVSFQVNNGIPPFSLVDPASGSFAGNVFTSNPIPFNDPYSIAFFDAFFCDTVVVADISKCNCVTQAGSVMTDTLTACVGETVAAIFKNDAVLEPDDTLGFILHDFSAFPYGNIFAYSNTPNFGFLPGMQIGVIYRISAIAGNNDGAGQVDLNDPCLSVSNSVPVQFIPPPELTVFPPDTVCAGDPDTLRLTMTGIPPYSVTYAIDGGMPVVINNLNTPTYDLILFPTDTSTVVFTIADQNCTNAVADTVALPVNQPPSWGTVADSCDQSTNTYTISVPMNGVPPYLVTGLGGSITGNVFTSDPIPFGQSYFALLTNSLGCSQDTLTGVSACNCTNFAGTMDLTVVPVGCGEDTVSVQHNGNQVLGPGDVFYFVLHTGPADTLGMVLDSSNTPTFVFLPGIMSYGTTYYVSAIVESGTVSPDPCRSVADGVPVTWYNPPTAVMSGDADICLGQSTPITVVLTGTAPYNLTYSSNGNPVSVVANQSPFIINAVLLDTTAYLPVSVNDQNCPGSVSGSATVTPHPTPLVQGLSINCAPGDSTYSLSFSVINADWASLMAAGAPAGTFDTLTGVFTSSIVSINTPYNYIISDQWMCGQDTISGMAACCSTTAGAMPPGSAVLCNLDSTAFAPATGFVLDPTDTLLYYLVQFVNPQTWSIIAVSDQPVFGFDPNTMTPNTPYTVLVVAGNQAGGMIDPNDPCLSVAIGPEATWQPPVTAELVLLTDTICAGTLADLQIILSGGASYDVTYEINGIGPNVLTGISGSPFQFSVAPPFSGSTYNLVDVSSNGCAGTVDGDTAVVFQEAPFQITNLQTICDNQQQNFELRFVIDNGAAPDPVYTVIGIPGVLTGNSFVSDPQPVTGGYNFVVTTALGCSQTAAGVVSCACSTEAGTLSVIPSTVCTNDTLVITPGGDAMLGPDDQQLYVLYSNPADPLGSIIATDTLPQFLFQAGMTTGIPYFVSIIAGNLLPGGGVDTTDPCLSLSATPVQVQFEAPPTAMLMLDTTVCPGSTLVFSVQFTGTAPFQFGYSLNGNGSTLTSPGPQFGISSSNIQQDQVYLPVSVSDKICSGTVSGSAIIRVLDLPSVDLSTDMTICRSDSAILTISLNNTDTATFDLTTPSGLIQTISNAVDGQTITVFANGNSLFYAANVQVTGNICPAEPGDSATLNVSTLNATVATSDYNGFGVSCFDISDGQITLTPTGGETPFNAVWDNGFTGLTLNGLGAGQYSVTLSDAAGCSWTDTITLSAPDTIMPVLSVKNAGCTDDENGVIAIAGISGGTEPYTITLNGFPFVGDSVTNLPAGDYVLEITDNNGCSVAEEVILQNSPPLLLEAGPDVTISLGDQTTLDATATSTLLASIQWTPNDSTLTNPQSLKTAATPVRNTRYTIRIEDSFGCTAEDSLQVIVVKSNRIYIPNVFRPNVQDGNEQFAVFAGPEVRNVRLMQIFDRWGEIVFEGTNLVPNETTMGWDGIWKDEEALPGVYIYVIELEFIDGSTETRSGDVTLLR